jgi:hypothetical protein
MRRPHYGMARMARMAHLAWIATAVLFGGAASAQPLPDPTRPMGANVPARAAVPGTPATVRPPAPNTGTSRATEPARPAPPPRLQALMTPQDGPPSALLDGELLQVGQLLKQAWRLERIGHDGVLLRRTSPESATPLWLPLLADPRLHKEP